MLALCVAPVAAQPTERANGLFLVARPGLPDPNFRDTVVLVTQTEDGGTVGVILNRPTPVPLREVLPGLEGGVGEERIFFGGPVMPRAVVVVMRSETPPAAPAFHVLRDVYLTMHPENIQRLLAEPSRPHRFFAGFAGWTPGQLRGELDRDGWYLVPARVEQVFQDDAGTLWDELVRQAEARPVSAPAPLK